MVDQKLQTGSVNLSCDLHKVNDTGAKDGILDTIINMSLLGCFLNEKGR